MRRIFILLLVALAWGHVTSQSPQAMSFQAVIRDANSVLLQDSTVGIQISILQGSINGTASYVERHTPTTNDNGLVTLEIGNGMTVSGNFATIDWSNGPYFLQTGTDLTGGVNYTLTGTSQLLSVPYALHAETAGSVNEADPVFGSSVAAGITGVDTANWNNDLVDDADADPGNEIQNLTMVGDTLYLSQANQVYIPNEDSWATVGNQTYNTTTGQVGINTTNPTSDLDVDGSVRVRSLSPTGLVWADSLGNLTSLGNGDKFESLAGQGGGVEPIWEDSTVYATTGNIDSGTSGVTRFTWEPSNKTLLVPEDGTYLIIFNARLFNLSTSDSWWKTRIYNVTNSTSLGAFFGMTKASAPLNADATTTGTLIDHLQKNDLLRIEYLVWGNGTSPYGMGGSNGIQGIHLVRLGK